MKVHTVTQEHSAAKIERTRAKPQTKADIPAQPMDARMQGAALCAEAFATQENQGTPWKGIAWKLIDMPADGRLAFQAAYKRTLEDLKEAHVAQFGDEKASMAQFNSATVQVSNLNTICRAWNAGASEQDMAENFLKGRGQPRDIGWMNVVTYARAFGKADAAQGDKTVKQRLVALVKTLGKGIEKFSDADAQNYTRAVEFVASLRD